MPTGMGRGWSGAPARQCGDDTQNAATAGTDGWVKARARPGGLAGCGGWRGLRRDQELSDDRESGAAAAIGEEAITADAMKAVGQAVDEETADELVPLWSCRR